MSEYQRIKARAQAMQREKEEQLKRELEAKQRREKEAERAEAERRKLIEQATKEARLKALKEANQAQVKPTSAANIEFDPFADDAVPGLSARPPLRKPSTGGAKSNGTAKKPSSSGAGPKQSNGVKKEGIAPKKGEASLLSRKEKAAMKLARQSKADSMFSVQSLVDMAEGTSSRSVSPRRAPPPRPAPSALKKSTTPVMAAKASAGKGIAGMKKSLDVSGLRKLCPDRDSRDRRTVDEIQRDIRARKGVTSGVASATSSKPSSAGPPRDSKDLERNRARDRRSPPRAAGKIRRRSPSLSGSDSDSSTAPRKRHAIAGPNFDGDAPASRAAVSALIQGMFSRGRPQRRYDDESDGSDMEAGLSDIDSEEKRAAKIARREDMEEERLEAERRAAKERAKRQRK
ncbi:hypothetical protein CC85DRAFT_310925 [Cutaneotrichosporon oleaginosum]|uniref:SPT2-domain-containing protein n=1 Tax=Cutaneotrichosporon oleaginosum TaxID=879819 RepID=A0A0J1BAF9_9TREE|nr:uncharacterized protein CC85DRAFT_310925 [Cutaneotrichosporon oleaginosum]KLT44894.1 hypothetical protein CC85DRAFT_310925 [Cutaneotrichosporon oleaginosum]TXT12025.1 hypothetical protein COLE_02435 [Cutaneotrichosporon oleaginosum]